MDLATNILIGIGLSMDSLAVSVASGIAIKKFHLKNMLKIAMFLSVFQSFMPVFGWLLGVSFQKYIVDFDHWIAFGLLLFLGLKMIKDGLSPDDDDDAPAPVRFKTLALLGLATSIDALAVGISFAFLQISIFLPVIIIGVITFIASLTGLTIGIGFGKKFNLKLEIFGGIVLIGIGVKILLEHTVFQ